MIKMSKKINSNRKELVFYRGPGAADVFMCK